MTEKRFTRDNHTGYLYDNGKIVEDIMKLLNTLNDENEQLKMQLQSTSDQRDEFHRGARENANRVGKLEKENEQLKQQMQRLYNYFADWFDDRVRPSDFSEMWDFVKEDEKWD